MGRGVRYISPKTCNCGGKLKKQRNKINAWKCKACGKLVISAAFTTLKTMLRDVVYADPKEVLNLDGPVVFGGGSKSGRKRKKKPKTYLGRKPLDI